jgi:hypothetical protein
MAGRKNKFPGFSMANAVLPRIVAPMVTLARSASGNTEEQFYERSSPNRDIKDSSGENCDSIWPANAPAVDHS